MIFSGLIVPPIGPIDKTFQVLRLVEAPPSYPRFPEHRRYDKSATARYTHTLLRAPFSTWSESVSSDVLEPVGLEYTVAQELLAVLDGEHNYAGPCWTIHKASTGQWHRGRADWPPEIASAVAR
ncbi:hypothetical protein KM043_013207 [Ampulex compressa]|nr:hypothetical protein KM043_013207 [Ampulex compressa]